MTSSEHDDVALGLSAVIIASDDVPRLLEFYRDALGLPLIEVDHGSGPHAECDLGDTHLAIFQRTPSDTSSHTLAFAVKSIEKAVARVNGAGCVVVQPVTEQGFGKIAGIRDPDGNLVQLTELSVGWLRHLTARREDHPPWVEELSAM